MFVIVIDYKIIETITLTIIPNSQTSMKTNNKPFKLTPLLLLEEFKADYGW